MASVSPAPFSSPSPASPSTPSLLPPAASNSPPSTPSPSPPQQSPPSNQSDNATPSSSPPPPSHQPSATSPPPTSETPPPSTPALSHPPPPTVPPATPSPTPPNAPPPTTPDPPSPVSSTPPTPSDPPPNSPPPPAAEPPQSPPPQSSKPPENPPPPPPPPSQANPPDNPSPPPQPINPPESSPPPPPSAPPETSPPSPASIPPRNSPPPPRPSPPPSDPSPSSPPPNSSLPPSPPPPPSRLSPPLPSKPPTLPSGNRTGDGSGPNDGGANSNSNSNGGISSGGVIAIGVAAGIVVLFIIGFVVWYIRKPRKNDSGRGGYIMPSSLGSSPKSESSLMKVHSSVHQDIHATGSGSGGIYTPREPGGVGSSRPLFTYEELFKATNAFSTQNLLGEGGFGSVYKGYLPDGRVVAVKELKIGGGQGELEFKAEVEIIGRVHHRHLVSLVGYCISEHQRLLVYDYVSNNSLYYHLHLKGNGELVLEWAKRIKIAAGAARGIAYLHEDCHPRIIHRDIKSSNILLDENFEARVSDFGLAKLALDEQTHITTRVVGTFGYVAPEYASSGKLTERSDVFSFGVVLLELITGRKAVDASQPMGNESLVEWARPLLNHALDNQDFETLVDPRLERNYDESEMLRMIGIAAACVRHSSAKRPQMGQVVRAFDSLATADLSNGMRFGESQGFDSGQQSAEIRFFRMLAFGNQDYSSDFYSQGSSNA